MTERLVAHENLPRFVRGLAEDHPELTDRIEYRWTVDDQGAYTSWKRVSSYVPLKPKLPPNIDPADVIDWYALPSWVKGSYRTEDEMRRLQSLTWVKGSESTYFAYEPNGRYAGMWERE